MHMYTHAHTHTQELNIAVLCLAVTNVADQRCPALLEKARETATKFKSALTLFSKCHQGYSGQSHLSDDDITNLGKRIYIYIY